ncbi:Copper amine oxidase N-terminal domain-containing protein [Paenibacillus sp. 1_12]|uniref:stalk domain-containing protein n=1 Tax=Paenibacillus sp. 1_12 TaxID=1566278 RepID=UPI0008E483D6|nr:stalk domain-containing protein [Paenibacillus sp. 1_12]SFM56368.1 Copper amine oxidase N-terminal domain-containing protein [Paenibacillus sp. 1_12]
MKRKLIISLALSVTIVGSMSIGAFAAANLEEISAYLNKGLGLKLNGKAWQPKDADGNATYPITYNGSTYLPARAVAEALGTKIGYDTESNTVLIGENLDAIPSKGMPGKSRSNPETVGKKVDFMVNDISNEYSGNLSVDQVIRGEEAWKMIVSANKFNSAPKEGYEYLLAKISIMISSSKNKDKQIDVSPLDFVAVSSAGKDYDWASIVEPDPSISSKLYECASHTGWAAFLVKKDDQNPVITYGRKYDGSGGAWFNIK